MTTFTLDTSGQVRGDFQHNGYRSWLAFDDLTAFAQGYVEAMLRSITESRHVLKDRIPADLINAVYRVEGWTKVEGEGRTKRVKTLYELSTDARAGHYKATPRVFGFRHLAPATLSRIIGDCEGHGGSTAEDGRRFYALRQMGDWGEAFPPLTVTLGEDGLIYLREGA